MPDQFDPRALDPLSQFRLDGKVVLVTGASSGLGVRFARVLHAVGAQVAISARRADRREDLQFTQSQQNLPHAFLLDDHARHANDVVAR